MSDKIEHIEKAAPTSENTPNNGGLGGALDSMRESKNKAIKGFINNKGLFVGIILVFIVILVFTTNVNFQSTAEIIKLSLVIFVFMFCSYSMYVNCADSGTRAGKNTSLYTTTKEKYDVIKKRIIDGNNQMRLSEFCRYYIDDELKNARKDILDGVGIDYDEYLKMWVGVDKITIESDGELSKGKKAAIIKANAIKPVKLTPEMIMKCGRGNKRRAPLGVRPETRKKVNYGVKLITTISTSLFTCMLALEVISNPSWATFAELCIKLLMVVLSGFTGYKMGYENITVSTVDYILDQTDLLNQFEQYLDKYPVPVAEEVRGEESLENEKIEVETPSA
jgi:energy-coupling factor transporter transmembrane protein EcfT